MSDKCRVWAVTVSQCHSVSSWPGGGMTPPFTLSDFEVQVSGGGHSTSGKLLPDKCSIRQSEVKNSP